mmetsp:Transcript_54565/g.137774  ORF Transcript_54565/g.137774 Transcript_54565/m.137774 type:complete len:231 (+) Transcript_54565:380-1072(+)
MHPDRCLGEPDALVSEAGDEVVRLGGDVDHASVGEHAGVLGLHAVHEDLLPLEEVPLRDGLVTYTDVQIFAHMVGHRHDLVGPEQLRVDLLMEPDAHALRDVPEERQILLLVLPSFAVVVVEEVQDASSELGRDLPLLDVGSDARPLEHALDAEHLKLVDRARDATHEGGEHEEGEQDHACGEATLPQVVRVDVVRRRSQLRKRPVKRHSITERRVSVLQVMESYPSLFL